MNEPRPLLELYKLLWEQIKDDLNPDIIRTILSLRTENKVTEQELKSLSSHYINNYSNYETRRESVQRMIKELENDK